MCSEGEDRQAAPGTCHMTWKNHDLVTEPCMRCCHILPLDGDHYFIDAAADMIHTDPI